MEKWLDDLYDLCETVSREIGEANEKIRAAGGKLSGADIDYIDKITHTMKSIKTTIAMAEAEEGGESGYYPYMGGYGYRSYENGGGQSNRRGGGRSNQRRDSRGRYSRENRGYSRADAREDFIEDVRELMQDAPDERTKMRFKEFIREMESD